MSTKKLLFLILFLTSPLSFSTDYTDDADKVDFYVPGVLANDGLEMVNFLLCFMESTNFSTFIGKGKYAAHQPLVELQMKYPLQNILTAFIKTKSPEILQQV